MFQSDQDETQYADGFAYRVLGPEGGVPLVLLNRLRGTIDHWDPAFLDDLAKERRVVVFDNEGVNASEGRIPDSVEAMAAGAVRFLRALGLGQVDLLGWSMGGFVAQSVALDHPELVRKLIVAGSSPGGVPDSPAFPDEITAKVGAAVSGERNGDEDFLFLFFPEAAWDLGRASLRRLDARLSASGADVPLEGVGTQWAAIQKWVAGGAWSRLPELRAPALYANGAHDVMVTSYDTYAAGTRVADSRVVLYGDAGHAFLFQHPEEFGGVVRDFLR